MQVKKIHQIEITSRCNLKCRYCVWPHMKRDKMDMDRETYIKALTIAGGCAAYNDQKEINLCGIGESTMHPDFIEYIRLARDFMPPDCLIIIASNGIAFTEQMARVMYRNNVKIAISMHRPEKAGPAIELGKRYHILWGVSSDPSTAAIDWAGQVDWHVSAPREIRCPWLFDGRVMVCSDGSITTCCLDGDGLGVIGHIDRINTFDDLKLLELKQYSLCGACHHIKPGV